ncbi:putative prolyl endopeptidase [Dictyocaulus viviparus]|uniref:Prolyl endopeptidase n=1 Tax=Dictyocaulus viviparus TaxID=29172 RepID=A0A0D8X6Z7_DICVI|nr:putative prolyl endopeptidase [Dictyocaulus viviparus]
MFTLKLMRRPPIARKMRVSPSIPPTSYPTPRRDETVVDDFHGIKIADPYRWMEDPDSSETQKFVNELNAISEPFLAQAPSRDKIRQRLTELWDYEKYSCPSKRGNFYYYSYNSGLQNQFVIYQQKDVTEKGEVFLDPNTDDGTTSIRISAWTKDGSMLAYGLSEKGSDWVTVKFRDANRKDLVDVIKGVKHSTLSWMKDNSGLFYCKYPYHKTAIEGTSVEKHEYHSLYFHRMDLYEMFAPCFGVFEIQFLSGGTVTDDGRFLIIDVSRGCDPYNMLYCYDLSNMNSAFTKIDPKPLFDKLDARYEYVDHDENSILIYTNYNAPMFKLVRVSLSDGLIKEVIPEHPRHKLDWAVPVAGDRLIICYIEDVKNELYVHDLNTGALLYQIPLKVGSISGFFGKKFLYEMFFSFESFTVPTVIYRIEFPSGNRENTPEVQELRRVRVKGMDENHFAVEQVFFESKDKTKIPMYIVSLRSTPRNGNTPTMLNGYGGFNISEMPYFSISRLFFVKHFGGFVACANLRGGSEYGENWHMSGMREKKQNVFDDFICAAEYLIGNNYTCNEKLIIHGGSNGGLLVAACSQQRPELYGAVLNRVGVMDMLRFHKFTVGGAWVPEYGNPDLAEDFKFIYKYSPLHNIRFPEGGQWPSTLMMTADHDDRVVPCHTLKYAATLYNKAKQHPIQGNPLLVRVEVKAGHGAGKPTSKVIAEIVDMYSFLQIVINIEWRD